MYFSVTERERVKQKKRKRNFTRTNLTRTTFANAPVVQVFSLLFCSFSSFRYSFWNISFNHHHYHNHHPSSLITSSRKLCSILFASRCRAVSQWLIVQVLRQCARCYQLCSLHKKEKLLRQTRNTLDAVLKHILLYHVLFHPRCRAHCFPVDFFPRTTQHIHFIHCIRSSRGRCK